VREDLKISRRCIDGVAVENLVLVLHRLGDFLRVLLSFLGVKQAACLQNLALERIIDHAAFKTAFLTRRN